MRKLIDVSSSSKTEVFYDDLMDGKVSRGVLGKDNRFDAIRIAQRESTNRFYTEVIKPFIKETDRVLDFGCGPGTFLGITAPLCKEIVGTDISQKFIDACEETIKKLELTNASTQYISPGKLPFKDESFDAIIMVDVIHHLEHIDETLKHALKVLKPGGRLIVFEPNKLNPLMALMHFFDRNEWGLLKLGTPQKYRKVLGPYVQIDRVEFNGIVIGPESRAFTILSDFLNNRFLNPFLGWLNPKMFVTGTKLS